jgi:hypothetical protein
MANRIEFSSASAKGPTQIRRELRNLWEGCIDRDEAFLMTGAADHPRRAEFDALWDALED